MGINIIKRIGQTVVILLGVALLIFIMLRIIPGNAIVTMMGEHANAEAIERMTAELGLDQPFYVQFWRYISGVVSGDLGTSYSLNRPVGELIATSFPNTLRLAIAAALFATSVPVIPIAQPMSAALSAGASFTPSPVIATTWPFFCQA